MIKIGIIGTGNVGGALATKWANAGHQIFLGVRDVNNFKGEKLLAHQNTSVHSISEAVLASEVILVAGPSKLAVEITQSLGDTSGKIIIDSMNVVNGNGPHGFSNTSEAILANTLSKDVVKCFNTTGYNNMLDTEYEGIKIDMFTCGNSANGKKITQQLALDAGFGECYDIGGNDKFDLMEQFALFWINMAMFQGLGRDIGFKLLKR